MSAYDLKVERNSNRNLMAYSLKTAKKNTGADALRESPADKSYGNNAGDEIIVGDLIDFVNTFTDDTIKVNSRKSVFSVMTQMSNTREFIPCPRKKKFPDHV